WRHVGGALPSLGFTSDHCWFRFTVHNGSNLASDWRLLVNDAMLGKLDVYTLGPDAKLLQHYQAGLDRRFDIRPIDYPEPVFPVTLPPGENRTIVIGVSSPHSIQLPLTLMTQSRFEGTALRQTL